MAKAVINTDEDHVKHNINIDMQAHEEKHGKIKTVDHIFNFIHVLALDPSRCTKCGFPEKYHILDSEKVLKVFNRTYLRCPEV